jgi:hypothetical protein
MSWLVAAAEAAEEHKDHTAYYVAGIVLAGWAVIVSAIGITQVKFPTNKAGRGVVVAITAVLVLATTSMAVATS